MENFSQVTENGSNSLGFQVKCVMRAFELLKFMLVFCFHYKLIFCFLFFVFFLLFPTYFISGQWTTTFGKC